MWLDVISKSGISLLFLANLFDGLVKLLFILARAFCWLEGNWNGRCWVLSVFGLFCCCGWFKYLFWYFMCGGLMVELSDEVKKYIEKVVEKTVRDEIVKILPSTVVTREDLRLATETINKRFEAVNERFKAIDKRFEDMNRRFEALQKYMDRRFEDMNRRFEDMFRMLRIMFITISLLIAIFGFLGIYIG